MTTAGIVLVGGQSSRMGTPKAALEWHGSTLLRRTVGVLDRVTDGPVLVVRAPAQPLPPLPSRVRVLDDPTPGRGPVVGLAAGLGAAERRRADTAIVVATDLPFLHPAYLRRVRGALTDEFDVVLPHSGEHIQPLATVYRTALAGVLARMAQSGEFQLHGLFAHCRVRHLDRAALLADAELVEADPELDSLTNINSPGDYARARARPGPTVTVWLDDRPRQVAAATLAEAAAACGIRLSADRDGEQPLCARDEIRLG